MSHLTGQTLLLEDIAVDTLVHSSFGTVVMTLFQGLLTAPSWQTFPSLACGWSLATDRHTITTSLWLTGATTVKHFSRFSVFLGCPLSNRRWPLWGAVIRLAVQCVPAGEVMRVICDETTKKKAGTPIEGLARYRHGAGSARQAYRTLRGLHFVVGVRRMPLKRWPGHSLSVPVGLELSLKPAPAQHRNVPYRSRSQLARDILDCMAQQVPGRPIRSLADGGYATKDSVRQWPDATHVVGRLPISAKLSTLPPKPTQKRRGAPRKKGDLIGSPQTLAQTAKGWSPHPSEAGAERQAWCGLWHAVLPGRLVRVVVLRRDGTHAPKRPGHRKPPPALEAFFTTDLTLSAHDILHESSGAVVAVRRRLDEPPGQLPAPSYGDSRQCDHHSRPGGDQESGVGGSGRSCDGFCSPLLDSALQRGYGPVRWGQEYSLRNPEHDSSQHSMPHNRPD